MYLVRPGPHFLADGIYRHRLQFSGGAYFGAGHVAVGACKGYRFVLVHSVTAHADAAYQFAVFVQGQISGRAPGALIKSVQGRFGLDSPALPAADFIDGSAGAHGDCLAPASRGGLDPAIIATGGPTASPEYVKALPLETGTSMTLQSRGRNPAAAGMIDLTEDMFA